jgi:hypothetical protein
MRIVTLGDADCGKEPDLRRLEEEVVELSLLLPGWQLGALEKTAQSQGLTTAQVVRRLIRDYLFEEC